MTPFDPISALAGGALIGLGAVVLALFNGRVAGISGILGGLLDGERANLAWRAAFVAGLVVASAKETEWIHRNLEPYRVLFVATFFASVGMLVDISFLLDNWLPVTALVLLAFFTNTLIMTEFGYQMVLGVIVGTLVLGPAWIGVLRPLRGPSARVAVES